FTWAAGSSSAVGSDRVATDYAWALNGSSIVATQVTDRLKNLSNSYAYDSRNNKIRITDLDGVVTTNTFSAADDLLTTTDGHGNRTTYTWDGQHNLLTVFDNTLNRTIDSWTYDATNQVLTHTDVLGDVTTFAYAANHLLASETNASSKVVRRFTYNANNTIAT